MKNIFFIFGFILINNQFLFPSKTNNDSSYAKFYCDISVNLSSKSPQKALHLADSLYKNALADRKRIKALLLSAEILVKQDKRVEGIKYALNALKLAKRSTDYKCQARIYGFLSTECRSIGLYKKGKLYLMKGLSMSSKLSDAREILEYQASVDRELAEYALISEDFSSALMHVEKAANYYKTLEEGFYKSFVLANIQQLIGRCYIGLNEYTLALNNFKNANNNFNKPEAGNSVFAALIYQGIGESYLKLREIDSAKVYLTKALQISEPANNTFLKEKVYEGLSKYFQDREKPDSTITYLSKYNQIVRASRNRNKRQIDLVWDLLKENPKLEATDWMLELAIGLLLISGVIGVYIYRNKKYFRTAAKAEDVKSSVNKSMPMELSPDIIEKFNQQLALFEYQKRFLDKSLSYSKLASEMGTNTKYLNYFFKHCLDTDYRTYINRLRIQFAVDELKTKPDVRKYTLAHLAGLSGYGSYSTFAVNFKRVMKQSPSTYIKNLD